MGDWLGESNTLLFAGAASDPPTGRDPAGERAPDRRQVSAGRSTTLERLERAVSCVTWAIRRPRAAASASALHRQASGRQALAVLHAIRAMARGVAPSLSRREPSRSRLLLRGADRRAEAER